MELSVGEARAIALTAQGFGRPDGDLLQVAAGLGAIQIDAVNVLIRSHYLPATMCYLSCSATNWSREST
jgi:uncharacterized protein